MSPRLCGGRDLCSGLKHLSKWRIKMMEIHENRRRDREAREANRIEREAQQRHACCFARLGFGPRAGCACPRA